MKKREDLVDLVDLKKCRSNESLLSKSVSMQPGANPPKLDNNMMIICSNICASPEFGIRISYTSIRIFMCWSASGSDERLCQDTLELGLRKSVH